MKLFVTCQEMQRGRMKEIMIKEGKVSLWLGFCKSADGFEKYMAVSYDADGNYVPSKFQENYAIKRYDLDAIECEWIAETCSDVESLLTGFSYDDQIIPCYKKKMEHKNIQSYNCIVLLYSYELLIIGK